MIDDALKGFMKVKATLRDYVEVVRFQESAKANAAAQERHAANNAKWRGFPERRGAALFVSQRGQESDSKEKKTDDGADLEPLGVSVKNALTGRHISG